MNAVNKGAKQDNFLTAAEIRATAAAAASATVESSAFDQILKPTADVSLTMSFDFYAVNNTMFHKSDLYAFRQGKPNPWAVACRVPCAVCRVPV